MKKLIAQRPIQYMGRAYQRGDILPAHETKMVNAWLNAGTAVWYDADRAKPDLAGLRLANDHMAADALRRMGVMVENEGGDYVGDENIAGQLRAICGDSPQESADDQEGQEPAEPKNSAQEAPDGGEMLDAHLDAEQLATWKNADLEKLAADLGVDISKAKNKVERAQLIAAARVWVPADDPDGEDPQ